MDAYTKEKTKKHKKISGKKKLNFNDNTAA
jgi:hypothetical protein